MPDATPDRSLEDRLRAIEDRLEIYNLIASHPPSADTAADFYTEKVYMADGEFDRGAGLSSAVGAVAVGAITQTPAHRQAIADGIAHFPGLPIVDIYGDSAIVTSYLQLLYPDKQGEARELANHGVSQGYRVHRVVANRWELVRTPDGWKIAKRTLRPLDSSPEGRDILRAALEKYRDR
ncbi:MAG: nuclear transport factor 2 family protein [Alphaproteobacteria bacterium]|jgi:hypothetical protein